MRRARRLASGGCASGDRRDSRARASAQRSSRRGGGARQGSHLRARSARSRGSDGATSWSAVTSVRSRCRADRDVCSTAGVSRRSCKLTIFSRCVDDRHLSDVDLYSACDLPSRGRDRQRGDACDVRDGRRRRFADAGGARRAFDARRAAHDRRSARARSRSRLSAVRDIQVQWAELSGAQTTPSWWCSRSPSAEVAALIRVPGRAGAVPSTP